MILSSILAKRATQKLRNLKWEFWIGNLVIVFSTILGVYLASHTALETAIKFEALRGDRDDYYARSAVHSEIQHNILALENIIKRINEGSRYYSKDTYITHPQYNIWESLKKSSHALTTPPKIIEGVNEFYSRIRIILDRVDKKQDQNMLFSAKELQDELDRFKGSTLKLLENNLAELKSELTRNNIKVN